VTVPRLVLDASVVLAALLTPNRRSASCLLVEAIGTSLVQLVVSVPVMAEYRRTVEEHAAGSRLEDPLGLVLDLGAAAERVEPTGVQVVKADPSDDVYLGTALAGQASYLATFDRRHLLPLDPWKGVRILTPGDVLRAIRDRY
jgi:predicted nucleic acid-binding protein